MERSAYIGPEALWSGSLLALLGRARRREEKGFG